MRQSELEARAGADSVARAIGGRVRQGRNGRGWTLDQLAERCGVSRRMLVSIEQGSANPSIATLLLISDALGIGLPALVDMGRAPGLRVTRAGTAPVLWRGELGGQAVLVAGTEPPAVDAAVFALRPDYRVLLLAVDGLVPGPGDQASDALLAAAEAAAREALRGGPTERVPHTAAWREAYRAFGAKPQRTRNSLEALLRRAPSRLPRVNRLTDCYNAVSVLHQIPVG